MERTLWAVRINRRDQHRVVTASVQRGVLEIVARKAEEPAKKDETLATPKPKSEKNRSAAA